LSLLIFTLGKYKLAAMKYVDVVANFRNKVRGQLGNRRR
jgi:hypothetical protein